MEIKSGRYTELKTFASASPRDGEEEELRTTGVVYLSSSGKIADSYIYAPYTSLSLRYDAVGSLTVRPSFTVYDYVWEIDEGLEHMKDYGYDNHGMSYRKSWYINCPEALSPIPDSEESSPIESYAAAGEEMTKEGVSQFIDVAIEQAEKVNKHFEDIDDSDWREKRLEEVKNKTEPEDTADEHLL